MKHTITTFVKEISTENGHPLSTRIKLATIELNQEIQKWEEKHESESLFSVLSEVTIDIEHEIVYATLISSELGPWLTTSPADYSTMFNGCGCK